MAVWLFIIVSAIVSILLIGWGYASNVQYSGFEHIPLYIGFTLLAATLFGAVWKAFRV
jgi:hypothetical protein